MPTSTSTIRRMEAASSITRTALRLIHHTTCGHSRPTAVILAVTLKRGQIKTIRRKDVRKRVLFSLAVLGSIALVLGFLFFTAGSSRAASAGSFSPTPIPSVPVPVANEPELPPSAGVPAVLFAGGGPPRNADIRAFVAKYGFSGGKMAKGGVPTIL